jgi:hypothetical protein
MSKILKGIKLIESPSEFRVNQALATGKAVRDTNEIQKYAIVDGTGKFIDGPYDYWLEADAKLKGLSKKYAQVTIVPISGKNLEEDLHKWFKEKWVRFGPDGKIRGDCARGDDSEGKPKCLPQAKAHALGKKGRKYAASKKRREDPNPERSGPAKNVATKKKTNEDVEGNLKEIELKFKTIELSNDNIVSYAKNYFESNNIEAPYQKFISNVKLLSNPKLIESTENAEIQEFLKALTRLDTKKKIKVGDKFAVLAFEIRFAWREIDALGFTEPKEVADIKLHSDGTINYIKFTDGDRYPRLIPATRDNKPIVQAVYFDDKNKAEKALTYLTMIMPDNWEIDLNSLVRQETKKDVTEEQLDELKCWPGYSRVQGVPAGAPGSCKKKTNEEHDEKCPHCGSEMVSEELMNEKQDACYYKVKSRYKVWPSAYASGALVKCRKKGAKNWGNKSESAIMRGIQSEGNMLATDKIDISKFKPGVHLSHGLLGPITVVKIDGSGLIVTDKRGNRYKIGLSSIK